MQEIQRNNVSPVMAAGINYFELQKGFAACEQRRRSCDGFDAPWSM
jgi:hypothetical protein